MSSLNDSFNKEWDDMIGDHKKTLKKGKQLFIECFLAEIKAHKYDTAELIVSSLNTHLDKLNKELDNVTAKV